MKKNANLKNRIKKNEGFSFTAYKDIHGYNTIGYGHLIKKNEPLIQFLNSLKNHHSISIVTSASKKNALSVLEYFQLKDWFDVMIFGDDVKHHKPNPEGYFLCLDKLNAKSDECLAFEDSSIGIEAAKQAGLQVLKIPCFL